MRTVADHGVTAFLAVLATLLVIAPLAAIFGYLVYKGASSLNLAFFTQIPKPEGEVGGGMANAIVGSAVLLGLASVIGVPIGIGSGIFLAEFGRGSKFATAIRFHRRRPQRRSLHRDGHNCIFAHRQLRISAHCLSWATSPRFPVAWRWAS